MKKGIVTAMVILGVGVEGSRASAQLSIQGSDRLDAITHAIIASCGLIGQISFIGGGSSGGQAAMVAGRQHMAPMTRELNSTGCNAGPSSAQLLIGLDSLAVVGANQSGADPSSCSDDISGGFTLAVPGCTLTDGCSTPGLYTFSNWRDVLAMLYAGLNNVTSNGSPIVSGMRNPARVNCASPVRRLLADNYGTVVSGRSCNGAACVRLTHIFRTPDVSGASEMFATALGMGSLPNYATNYSTSPTANASPNPFCNAGTAPMNKGDSDYLDLDPIRRPCKFKLTSPRANIEDVCAGYAAANNTDGSCTAEEPFGPGAPTEIERSAFNGRGLIPINATTGARDNLRADLKAQGCLGLVLPIAIPTNIPVANLYPTKACTAGGFRALAIPAAGVVCPDGFNPPCALPAIDNGPGALPTFDCLSDSATPTGVGLRDGRIFNTFIFNSTGQVMRDNFNNPNFVDPREARVARPFFRLHTRHVDTTSPAAPTGGPCNTFTEEGAHIGCLVKASPCSIGVARHGAMDQAAPFQNFGFRVAGVVPVIGGVPSLTYPMTDKLWVNSYVPGGVAFGPSLTAAEQQLYACFSSPAMLDPIMVANGFKATPATFEPRLRGCPAGAP